MKPTDTLHTQDGSIPTPGSYPLYEYPAYTFDRKYENDEFQKKVITLDSGYHLVLAPPGCGKTDILAERVVRALSCGVSLDDMLCLTFTNRAARGMRSRILERLQASGEMSLFVGNVHRFCSHYLFDNNVVARDTTVIDEQESLSIMASIFGWDEGSLASNGYKRVLTNAIKLQHLGYMTASGCPKEFLMHTDLFRTFDYKTLFKLVSLDYTMENFAGLYTGTVFPKVDTSGQPSKYLDDCLQQFKFARKYQQYKEERNLVDFDDLLILTYIHASQNRDKLKKYSWIQIDEVQDLSPFQFGIIDLFTDHSKENVTLYLGDEQQAIFSFIGAKLATLEWLRERCGENMHRLYFNYRSPKYLLDVFNTYANMELDVDPHFLPKTNNLTEAGQDSLCILSAPEKDAEVRLVAESVGNFCTLYPAERVAVLVPWNKDADQISRELSNRNIPHFKISGTDLFTTRQAQLLFAHLQVVYLDSNMMAWSKILTGTGIFNEDSEARRFVKYLRDNYLLPSDFLNYTRSSYMLELYRCCQGEYVIFDTETTGLNVFEDDIVQIAAIKVNAGKITDRFNIILHTDKPIPAMLGGIVNPLLQEYERAEKVDRKTGLCAFMDFVGDCTLIGQNVEYDCYILDYNLRRDCGDFSFFTVHPLYFDTLRVARIMAPRLKSYKLKNLLEVFGLEGENSHLADDDVIATLSVLDHFLGIFAANMQQHTDCLQNNSAVAELFRRAYADIYHGTLSRLYKRSFETPLLVDELEHLYGTFIQKEWITANPKMQYIFSFLRNDVISPEKTPSLKEQLSAHLLDITTYREADLCDSSCITEKVFVSTVHKAKGLEFENVIIFEATDGVYPFFDKKTPEEIRESARLFYVAMTRAKKRLHITYAESMSGISKWGNPYSIDKEPTPFLRHIKNHFRF